MAKKQSNSDKSEAQPVRRIEYVPLSELVLDESNPKAHDTDLIGDSVGRFGYVEPIVEDGRTGKLISGHGRTATLQAMHAEGQAPPDGVTVDPDGNWLVPVSRGWSSRSDSEARAALIALNRTGEVGGWVDESLMDLLSRLGEDENSGLLGVGFSEDDLDDLRAMLEERGFDEEGDSDWPDPNAVDGAMRSTSMNEYKERYEEQGKRLIILEYSVEDYALANALLRSVRQERGADNNPEALLGLLRERYPDVTAPEGDKNPVTVDFSGEEGTDS